MHFFVYGTLKVGGYFAEEFNRERRSSVTATLDGFCLYDLGQFPAIKEGDGKVVGELHTYRSEEQVLRAFDQIEGFAEGDPNSLYLRQEVNVVTEDGDVVKAIVYTFNGQLPLGAKMIEDGVWVLTRMRW